MLRWIKKKENCYWFEGLEKPAVLTELSSICHSQYNEKAYLQVIKKLLYLLNQGQIFTTVEACTMILSVSSWVFNYGDLHLRRLIYLIVKEFYHIVPVAYVGVTTSILKDINSLNIAYRANAIRFLRRINTDGTSSSTRIEGYLKEAIADKNNVVSSAALVCVLHLLKRNPGIGKLLGEQVAKLAWSCKGLVQFHALCIILQMHRNDFLGVEELQNKINAVRDPLGVCLLARLFSQVSRASDVSEEQYPGYFKYIKSCIYGDRPEMIALEGLHSIKELRNVGSGEVKAAMARGVTLLSSHNRVVRFSAFRAVHEMGMAHHEVGALKFKELSRFMKHDENAKNCYLRGMFKARGRVVIPATDAVTQVVKAQTEAPSDDNLRRRR